MRGWVSQEDYRLFCRLEAFQRTEGVLGGACEIGVFHGKRFIFLALSCRPGERALAIDTFWDDSWGDFEPVFRDNLARHLGPCDFVRVVRSSSASVTSADVCSWAGGPIRLFSVDGCHASQMVAHDLRTACGALASGGLIIVDDFLNEVWPGVAEATVTFLASEEAQSRGLVPFAIFSSKLFITDKASAAGYLNVVRVAPPSWRLTEEYLLGSPVVTIRQPCPRSLATMLAASPFWGALRPTPLGKLVRRLRRSSRWYGGPGQADS